jgi:3-hydroxyisobutyrate dehydrogenase-like beta-hydroxyacid dehydrogenase
VIEAARGADLVLTSLPSVEALDATVEALAAAPSQQMILAEISTFPIAAKERARDRLAAAGITTLDCPLSGTGAQAQTRDLALYGSGNEAAFDRCRDAFAGFARASHYLGAFGNGSRMKFVANLLVAVHNVAAAEAIVLGAKAGLDPERILEVIASGAGSSRIFELRGPMMARGVYTPPTATMHVLQKDSGIIAEFARALGVDTPMLAAAAPLYDEAEAQGYAEQDVAAVHAVLARRAGLPPDKSRPS